MADRPRLAARRQTILEQKLRRGKERRPRPQGPTEIATAFTTATVPVVSMAARKFAHARSRALTAEQLPASLLELELTESAVMSDAESSVVILEQLSRMGVVVAVDDFGTGYSNRYLLRQARSPAMGRPARRESAKRLVSQGGRAPPCALQYSSCSTPSSFVTGPGGSE